LPQFLRLAKLAAVSWARLKRILRKLANIASPSLYPPQQMRFQFKPMATVSITPLRRTLPFCKNSPPLLSPTIFPVEEWSPPWNNLSRRRSAKKPQCGYPLALSLITSQPGSWQATNGAYSSSRNATCLTIVAIVAKHSTVFISYPCPRKSTFTVEDLEREANRGASGRVSVPVGAIQIESPARRRSGEVFDLGEMRLRR